MILKLGDVGQEVQRLQQRLAANGIQLEVDGWFGDKTEKAVIRFQRQNGLFVDGIAGPATLAALQGARGTDKTLTEKDLKAAARKLGVQVAAIKAITEVESRESGFLPSGRPVILFERHIMYRRLGCDQRERYAEQYPEIVNRKPGGYVGGEGEWRRFYRAMTLDPEGETATESASWGLFQIMGFHWKGLGYASAEAYATAMAESEGRQLDAFVRFIKQDADLHQALKSRDWADFAHGYNGPAYARNQYDTSLAAAYERHRSIGRLS